MVRFISQFVQQKEKFVENVGREIIMQRFALPKNIAILENQETFAIDSFDFGDVNKDSKWSCVFPIHNGPSIEFKIDTGAEVNTISSFHFKKL